MYNRMVEGRRVAESAERRDGSLGSESNSHVYMILKAGVSMLSPVEGVVLQQQGTKVTTVMEHIGNTHCRGKVYTWPPASQPGRLSIVNHVDSHIPRAVDCRGWGLECVRDLVAMATGLPASSTVQVESL